MASIVADDADGSAARVSCVVVSSGSVNVGRADAGGVLKVDNWASKCPTFFSNSATRISSDVLVIGVTAAADNSSVKVDILNQLAAADRVERETERIESRAILNKKFEIPVESTAAVLYRRPHNIAIRTRALSNRGACDRNRSLSN